MRIGIGLPSGIPGTPGPLLIEWARRAEGGPFTSLGAIDRVAYDCHEPMAALAAAAAVTERVRLATMAVIAPLRSTGVLAKEAATIDALSGGRLTLGLAVGARTEDFDAAGVPHAGRGARFEEQLAELRDLWEGGPGPKASPELLVGGASDAAFARMARYGDGYVHSGARPGRSPGPPIERGRRGQTWAGRAIPRCGVSPTSPWGTTPGSSAWPTCATTTRSPGRSPSGSPRPS